MRVTIVTGIVAWRRAAGGGRRAGTAEHNATMRVTIVTGIVAWRRAAGGGQEWRSTTRQCA
jgi:hypothetical protein